MKWYLLFINWILIAQLGFSQSILDQYVEEGIRNNQQLLRKQLDSKIALENTNQAKSLFLPNASLDASYLIANGGRTINLPLGDLFNPVYQSLNQLTGSNNFPESIENQEEQLLPDGFHDTKIRIIQPLINSNIYYGYKARKSQLSMQEAKEKAYENQLRFQIKKAYYDYLKLIDQQRILDSTQLVIIELVKVNQKFVKNEVATRDIVYTSQMQLEQLRADQSTVKKHIQTSKMFFNFLLNRELEEIIITSESVNLTDTPEDLANLQSTALNNRNEIAQINNGIEAAHHLIQMQKGYLIPDLAVAGEFGYQGFDYKFDNQQDFYLLSFQLSMPLYQGGKNKSAVRKANYQKEQLEANLIEIEKQIQLDVASAYYELLAANEVYEARKAELKNAQENYEIVAGKYRQQQVLLVEYNTARTQLTTAQINTSIARFNIQIAKAYLEKSIS